MPDAIEVSTVENLKSARLAHLIDGDERTRMRFEDEELAPVVVFRFDHPVRVDALELTTFCRMRGCAGFTLRLRVDADVEIVRGDIAPNVFRATFAPPRVATTIRAELLPPENARPGYFAPELVEFVVRGVRIDPSVTTRREVLVPPEDIARTHASPAWSEPHLSICEGDPCGYSIALAARLCGLERFDTRHREAIEARPSPSDVRRFVADSCPRARDDATLVRGCRCPRYVGY